MIQHTYQLTPPDRDVARREYARLGPEWGTARKRIWRWFVGCVLAGNAATAAALVLWGSAALDIGFAFCVGGEGLLLLMTRSSFNYRYWYGVEDDELVIEEAGVETRYPWTAGTAWADFPSAIVVWYSTSRAFDDGLIIVKRGFDPHDLEELRARLTDLMGTACERER